MKHPTPLPAEQLSELRADYNFAEVFGEGGTGNTPPIGFTRADVAELYFLHGESEEGYSQWEGTAIGRLTDGRYFRASGWCDTTGWDCRGGSHGEVWADLETFIRELGDEDRARIGLPSEMQSPSSGRRRRS